MRGLGYNVPKGHLLNDYIKPTKDSLTRMRVKSTLVAVPSMLVAQWKVELARHAPKLKVLQYLGQESESDHKAPTAIDLARADVVVTSFEIMQKEAFMTSPLYQGSLCFRSRRSSFPNPRVSRCLFSSCSGVVENGDG